MPYNYYYRRRRWRRRPIRPWRFRRPLRRRYYRRRPWVRRSFYKKKLKKLRLLQYQPKSIRRCTIKGLLCLFQTTQNRLSNNFDMYEESWVPDRLPGGGGFSIKNLSLSALYEEHITGHNIFTHTNTPYPLVRYTGCTIKFYQSKITDYVATYSNSWPLRSNLEMYNTMQPSMHLLQKNKIIIPSKQTHNWKKQYKKKFIPPPTQMLNKWYFQKDIAKTPLFMLRTSATSFDNYYVGSRALSTNINIYSLNYTYVQNRKFGKREYTWYSRTLGTQTYFLWATRSEITQATVLKSKVQEMIPLINTQDFQPGKTYEEAKRQSSTLTYQQYLQNYENRGNPLYHEYLKGDTIVLSSTCSPTDMQTAFTQGPSQTDMLETKEEIKQKQWQIIDLGIVARYNPYKDKGKHNSAYFLSATDGGHGWDPPSSSDLRNDNLPLWLLLFGFSDFVKKTNIIHHVDEQYLIVLNTNYTTSDKSIFIPISYSVWQGHSPYENDFNPIDKNRWFLSYQLQQEAVNDICLSGPGTPKIPDGTIAEAKIEYKFHFKWGGDLPPMSSISDPTEQPWYPLPNNNSSTNSFQNPTTRPEQFLYSFDERRGQLTEKATKRMQKDWEITETSLFPTAPRFSETPALQDPQTQTSSEEEEEENLFKLLEQQRSKQQLLRHRIIQTVSKIQQLQ
nr:MAG: ORF1 [TTV-like mini virus]